MELQKTKNYHLTAVSLISTEGFRVFQPLVLVSLHAFLLFGSVALPSSAWFAAGDNMWMLL